MKNRYRFHLLYYLYWLLFFVISKGVFIIYQHENSASLTLSEILKVFLHGLYMDASFSAYICIFPFALLLLQNIIKKFHVKKVITAYTIFLIIVISFLTIADLELYRAWGFRLDATPLQYFKTPKEMMASSSASPLLLLIVIFVALSLFFNWLYLKFFRKYCPEEIYQVKLLPVFFSFVLLVFLFVPIRGGFQQIPINQSDVYFSDKIFANHAAINVPWNLMRSLIRKEKDFKRENPYTYFNNEVAKQYLDSLYKPSDFHTLTLLNTRKPNIIFIILESYTAKFVGCLGGEPGVTPNLDKIASEGMLFTNIYASGDRTEKGIVALLSGYPTQTITSIIKTPHKTESLPNLNKELVKTGYHSSYYYGGELEFANIRSYLVNAGYQKFTTKSDFNSKDYNSKWGVHDDILFKRLVADLKSEKQPFFSTLFTLSSHEPYDIPIAPKFPGDDETTKFKNSFYYTDQALGSFIAEAKKQSWWDSTLIVMVADHGHRLPGNDANDRPSKFRIPLVLTGGALKPKGQVNNRIGSQTDIVKTLLQQLELPAKQFTWSKNLLDSSAKQFAFYIFNDGFGFVTPGGALTFDNVSKKIIYKNGTISNKDVNYGKAYMQLSFADFLKR